MAAKMKITSVKAEAKMTKGTLTVPNVLFDATAEQIHTVVTALSDFHEEDMEKIARIEKSDITLV